MNTNNNIDIDALIRAPQLFVAYIAEIQARLQANRARRLRGYWTEAIQRLSAELAISVEEGDNEIAAELERVIAAFQAALDSTSGVASKICEAAASPRQPSEAGASTDLPVIAECAPPAALEEPQPLQLQVAATALPPIDEVRRKELAEIACDLSSRVGHALSDSAHAHDLAFEMRVRSLYCETEALLADPSLDDQDRGTVRKLNGDIAMYCAPSQGEFPFAFASAKPEVWQSLVAGYRDCNVACGALAWYAEHFEQNDRPDRVRLLNAIAAIQKRQFRLQEYHGGQDHCQSDLFKRIMEVKDTAGWLEGLDPNTSDEELDELAGTCEAVYDELLSAEGESRLRIERLARKEEAIKAVEDWEEALEGRGITTSTINSDRSTLCALLDECLKYGVPPSNVKIRTAILDVASVLLVDQPKYAKFLEAVVAERQRKKLDDVEVEQEAVQEISGPEDEVRRAVADFTRSKRVAILGGKKRANILQEISEALETDVVWLESEEGVRSSKHLTALKKIDVVLMLKNHSSHELFGKGRETVLGHKGHFVVLPAGYGVNQVVRRLHDYVLRGVEQ